MVCRPNVTRIYLCVSASVFTWFSFFFLFFCRVPDQRSRLRYRAAGGRAATTAPGRSIGRYVPLRTAVRASAVAGRRRRRPRRRRSGAASARHRPSIGRERPPRPSRPFVTIDRPPAALPVELQLGTLLCIPQETLSDFFWAPEIFSLTTLPPLLRCFGFVPRMLSSVCKWTSNKGVTWHLIGSNSFRKPPHTVPIRSRGFVCPLWTSKCGALSLLRIYNNNTEYMPWGASPVS